ncbi:hypothetical protein, partial [Klebsiella pneumoniae]|uniref:hypothetical protein n=2 Tax=Klebsiella pneumoniae TaxID=573 RepID=UPI003CE6F779
PVLFWFLFPERGQASGAYSFPEALPAGAFTTRFLLAHGRAAPCAGIVFLLRCHFMLACKG